MLVAKTSEGPEDTSTRASGHGGGFRVGEVQIKSEGIPCNDVLKDHTWPTVTAHELFRFSSEQSLISYMVRTDSISVADYFWYASIFPEGEVVHNLLTDSFSLVLRVAEDSGVLMWPCELTSDEYIYLNRPTFLEWTHVDDLKEWNIVNTTIVSPLRLMTSHEGAKLENPIGCVIRRSSADDSRMLAWHAQRAFAHLPQKTVKRLVEEYGLKANAELGKLGLECQEEAEIMALMMKVTEGMDANQCELAFSKRRKILSGEDTSALQPIIDDPEMLELVVPTNEANKWKSRGASEEGKRTQLSASAKATKTMRDKLFPAAKKAAAKAKGKAQGPKLSVAARKHRREQIAAGDFQAVEFFRPPMLRITVEEKGTCLRVWDGHTRLRSFSWFMRGKPLAISETLAFAWDYAKCTYEAENPFPKDAF
ncbi:unnamed protein product [Prorocentrum cordatum]|uniref:Uncharacterized protein n=1 Tax=Prorocentrum cordatum TaxID=2364126 RepID=A0ABN9P8L2_9DINO|nr:unnamed protein product [Polarella glacialis]